MFVKPRLCAIWHLENVMKHFQEQEVSSGLDAVADSANKRIHNYRNQATALTEDFEPVTGLWVRVSLTSS